MDGAGRCDDIGHTHVLFVDEHRVREIAGMLAERFAVIADDGDPGALPAVGRPQPVDQLVDAHFVVLDASRERKDLLHGRRARGDRLDHVLQAVLDALRDLDFALARQQFDRAHLAHVHAHRVGGAAELGVDRRQRRFGGFLGDDRYLTEMHLWLRRIGYRPYFSGIGRNVDCPELLTQRLVMTIKQAHLETNRPVNIIGHSLGGMLARAAAYREPRKVRQVITMGSPTNTCWGSVAFTLRIARLDHLVIMSIRHWARSLAAAKSFFTTVRGLEYEGLVESPDFTPEKISAAIRYKIRAVMSV